jgi:hypothetical protein
MHGLEDPVGVLGQPLGAVLEQLLQALLLFFGMRYSWY